MAKLTPMMAQYKRIKAENQDCILMFRLGDFYEMFFEDAVEASKILQITLTSRGKGGDHETPMCGVPFHAVDGYLAKLTRAGCKVAICDQVSEPDGKGIVEREVVRIVTPGTTFDENVLEQKSNNYVSAVVAGKDGFGLAFADITTGEFKVTELESLKELRAEIERINPAECVGKEEIRGVLNDQLCFFPFEFSGQSELSIKEHFQLTNLKSFDLEGRGLAISASAVLLAYLVETQKNNLEHVRKINFYRRSSYMPLDRSVIENLELLYSQSERKREGSLIEVLDQTVSSMGGRMLKKWLLSPLLDELEIMKRHEKVGHFVEDSSLLRAVRDLLSQSYDIERLLSRLSLGSGNARDLKAMQKSLELVEQLRAQVVHKFPEMTAQLHNLTALTELIESAIKDDAAATVREGGMICEGYNPELDELLGLSKEGKTFIQNLQQRESERTGITSLKVKFNKVFGYFIEISKSNLDAVPEDYIRKQTLVNAERFITPELKEYEEKVLNAESRIKELEYELFYAVRMEVVKKIAEIQEVANAFAEFDVLSNFADIAVRNNYCKPEIAASGFEVKNSRHPVVESVIGRSQFVPNDCSFNDARSFLLITGPNMGGKSTYLRQVAVLSLMAQIGSFIAADQASISIVDRIFTRVGASDNLARGESTFMVEMTEAAYILNNATKDSLIILDEIGRGTSTYDGVSIAWAMTEFIHDNIGAKTLFATHYHELLELTDALPSAVNLSVSVRENEKEGVRFLYKILEGGVDKSYGIEVAKLAGLPMQLVSRARGVLQELESKHIHSKKADPKQLGMFEATLSREHRELIEKSECIKCELDSVDIDNMTPIEALQKLSEIKKKM